MPRQRTRKVRQRKSRQRRSQRKSRKQCGGYRYSRYSKPHSKHRGKKQGKR